MKKTYISPATTIMLLGSQNNILMGSLNAYTDPVDSIESGDILVKSNEWDIWGNDTEDFED